ncbi:MAG: hypothetical protein K2N54_04915 [Helicobacter sp.]|nr:hypothetical protein [Helicobacter sp.]
MVGFLCLLIATLALTRNLVMLSKAKHLFGFLCFEILQPQMRLQNDNLLDSLEVYFFFFFVKGDRGLNCEAAPLSPFDPQTLARFFNVRYACICRAPQRCVSIIAFGTYGDVARCGWDY